MSIYLVNSSINYLQDVSPVIDETPPSDTPLQKALEAISYIGVIISIICLTVTVISYLANKSVIAVILSTLISSLMSTFLAPLGSCAPQIMVSCC